MPTSVLLYFPVMPPPPPPPPAGRPRNNSRGSDDDRRTPDTQQAAYNPHTMYGKCVCAQACDSYDFYRTLRFFNEEATLKLK